MIPDEWLRREFEKSLTPEELEKINSLGGLEKLIEAFQEAKAEEERRQAEEAREGNGSSANGDHATSYHIRSRTHQ